MILALDAVLLIIAVVRTQWQRVNLVALLICRHEMRRKQLRVEGSLRQRLVWLLVRVLLRLNCLVQLGKGVPS